MSNQTTNMTNEFPSPPSPLRVKIDTVRAALGFTESEPPLFQSYICKTGEHRGRLVYVNHDAAGRRFYLECDKCGQLQAVKKREHDVSKAIASRNIKEALLKKWAADLVEWKREQRTRYQDYLQSEHWRSLREMVIHRENGICQGCRQCNGEQVHHLTYARLGRELLIDLVLLCRRCHEVAHAAEVD